MKINFNVDYRTNWGESVYLVGDIAELGNNDITKALKLNLNANFSWALSVEIPNNVEHFSYRYVVKSDNGDVTNTEWGKDHTFRAGQKSIKGYNLFDNWNEMPHDKAFFSSAFTQGIFARECDKPLAPVKAGEVTLKIFAPMLNAGEVLAISGSIPSLGEWDASKAVVMNSSNFPEWSVNFSIKDVESRFEYKFLVLDRETKAVKAWEACDNRSYDIPPVTGEVVVVSGLHFNNPMTLWKGAGTAIPVFSLRSADDFGVGDFYDLFKMVDWAQQSGQRILQLLPINDTTMTHTWTDSYPYNANSTFALHPMYLRPNAIGELSDKAKEEQYRNEANSLNDLQKVDYEKVNDLKTRYIHDLYAELGGNTKKSSAYRKFVDDNLYWLKPYAAFCALRDEHGTPDFSQWGEYATFNEDKVNGYIESHKNEIEYTYFVQYHLDKQLREVRNYAHSHNVVLKGDIPIGISRTSVDAWVNPSLFYMDCQAGAPPDDFSVLGQNWGFPTYNWEEMNKDGFQWWKNRFRKMAEYFDAYRIDHILGFFRIWQIPLDAVHGLLGTFNPALPFSEDELRNNYDFWMNRDLYTTPYIMDYFIGDFFGEYTDEARTRFLTDKGYGRYGLQEYVNTQKKVVDYFATQEVSEKNEKLKNALLGLIDDVLFIVDAEQTDKYHPRISAQFTYVYKSLNDYERWCFNRLYNDFFYHRHNDFWYGKAMWKLPPLLNSTDMLVCGEDLGMIPDCVSAVMNQLQILSLEIQRMPKDPKQDFGNPYWYPYSCVCTTSTHDMSGIRGWWEEDHELSQRFFNCMLQENGEAPYFAEPWVCEKIVRTHLESPAMLTILPLQDWMSIDGQIRYENPQDEQINVPAISRHYWRYRMHLTIDDLISNTDFTDKLRMMIANSGR